MKKSKSNLFNLKEENTNYSKIINRENEQNLYKSDNNIYLNELKNEIEKNMYKYIFKIKSDIDKKLEKIISKISIYDEEIIKIKLIDNNVRELSSKIAEIDNNYQLLESNISKLNFLTLENKANVENTNNNIKNQLQENYNLIENLKNNVNKEIEQSRKIYIDNKNKSSIKEREIINKINNIYKTKESELNNLSDIISSRLSQKINQLDNKNESIDINPINEIENRIIAKINDLKGEQNNIKNNISELKKYLDNMEKKVGNNIIKKENINSSDNKFIEFQEIEQKLGNLTEKINDNHTIYDELKSNFEEKLENIRKSFGDNLLSTKKI